MIPGSSLEGTHGHIRVLRAEVTPTWLVQEVPWANAILVPQHATCPVVAVLVTWIAKLINLLCVIIASPFVMLSPMVDQLLFTSFCFLTACSQKPIW